MNIFSIIEELEKVDPDLNDRFSPRRAAIKNITSFGSKVAMAAAPFALATLFKRAYGQTTLPLDVNGVLNYALKLEYLEYEFYNIGVNTAGLIPAGAGLTALTAIRDHELQHVNFLKATLGTAAVARSTQGFGASVPASGGTVDGPRYDFTGGNGTLQTAPGVGSGPFNGVFANYDLFLAVAQVFEDTGVRAYKGQAANLINNAALAPALRIHSTEARHAAHLRYMRRNRVGVAGATFQATGIKPWISGSATVSNDTGVAAADGNYGAGATNFPAENNVTQGGANVTTLPSALGSTTGVTIAIEAYDEPLDAAKVVSLVGIFGVK